MQSKNYRVQVYPYVKEFIYVAELITRNDSQSYIKALSYLQIWCERKNENKIPRSIYLTYILLDVFHNQRSEMALSLVLSKFISSECKEEEDKNNYNYKIPIYATAKNIRLPAYMVKLRHDIIHGYDSIPMDQLIKAYHDAVNWLKDHFWRPQLDQIQMDYYFPEQISELLDDYMHIMKSEKTIDKNNDCFKRISFIFNGISSNEFFSVLLSDKYLLNHKITKDSEEYQLKTEEFWFPMLEFLDESKQIDTLVELIFDILGATDHTSTSLILIRHWCCILLDSCCLKRKSKHNELKFSINHVNVENVNWISILGKFIEHCLCKENMDIFKKLIIVRQLNLSKEKILSIVEENKPLGNVSVGKEIDEVKKILSCSPFGV